MRGRGEKRPITRRRFLGVAAGAGTAAFWVGRRSAGVAGAQEAGAVRDLVDPFIGVANEGQTLPGAQVPFGFASVGPDTTDPGEFYNTSGYDPNGEVLGFSQTHVGGTGGRGKYGNFRLTPLTGAPRFSDLASGKGEEAASPGYYAVELLRSGVAAEVTATRMCGLHRYAYPAGATPAVVLDATSVVEIDDRAVPTPVSFQQRPTASEVRVVGDDRIEGSASFEGGWNPGAYTLHFSLQFDRPFRGSGTFSGGETMRGAASARGGEGERVGAYASFEPAGEGESRESSGATVMARIGLSWVGVEKARENLEREIPSWDFGAVRGEAGDAWEAALSKVRVEGGSDADREIFYTALYRAHFMPHDVSGENAAFGTGISSRNTHYEDYYALWDTFRTVHPLLTLIQPDRQREMVDSLVAVYEDTGWMPDSRVAGTNGLTQGGSHGDVLVADAIVKGLSGIDYETAYEALKKNAEVEPARPMFEGRGGISEYKALGYVSLDTDRSGTRTVEYAHDDFCVAQVARALGDEAGHRKYLARSRNWRNLWDREIGAIRPRYKDGRFLENFDRAFEYPGEEPGGRYGVFDAPFYEGSAYQYSTFVPHDVRGLVELLGGDDAFVSWLDRLFERGVYTQANEPDILAPYLYLHAGRHDKTAERVRRILASGYGVGGWGLPGNDDAGTMSSWYVWGAVGLYPLAGQPFYYVGSPVFPRATLDLGGGTTFAVEAPETSEENSYVQSASLNGSPLDRAWLRHDELAGGGTLRLEMGPEPSGWGSENRPPSPAS